MAHKAEHHAGHSMINVYEEIVRYKIIHGGQSPSIPDLMYSTGYASTRPVAARLVQLEREGFIRRVGNTPRSITVIGEQWIAPPFPEIRPDELSGIAVGVLQYIYRYASAEGGTIPTLTEIAEAFEWKSFSTAKHHIDRIIESGYLKKGRGHRGLMIPHGVYTIEIDKVPESARALVSAVLAEELPRTWIQKI